MLKLRFDAPNIASNTRSGQQKWKIKNTEKKNQKNFSYDGNVKSNGIYQLAVGISFYDQANNFLHE